jgi:DNA-binding PadR family transcriptional regulator
MTNRNDNSDPGQARTGEGPLTSAQFHILLTLADGEKHGYGIMLEIESRTSGAVELGPGTLYRSIKQLLARGLIEELVSGSDQGESGGKHRRLYALTKDGLIRTKEEALRLKNLMDWANDSLVLEGGTR